MLHLIQQSLVYHHAGNLISRKISLTLDRLDHSYFDKSLTLNEIIIDPLSRGYKKDLRAQVKGIVGNLYLIYTFIHVFFIAPSYILFIWLINTSLTLASKTLLEKLTPPLISWRTIWHDGQHGTKYVINSGVINEIFVK